MIHRTASTAQPRIIVEQYVFIQILIIGTFKYTLQGP